MPTVTAAYRAEITQVWYDQCVTFVSFICGGQRLEMPLQGVSVESQISSRHKEVE